MSECKRCKGNGWVLYEVQAKQFEIYKEKEYRIQLAKRCPECTKAQADSWERDYKDADSRQGRL